MDDADELYEDEEATPTETPTPFSLHRVAADWLNAAGSILEVAAEFPYSIARGLAGHDRHIQKQRDFQQEAALEIERLTERG